MPRFTYTGNLRWIIHEEGTPREHRVLQQEILLQSTTEFEYQWRDVPSLDVRDMEPAKDVDSTKVSK